MVPTSSASHLTPKIMEDKKQLPNRDAEMQPIVEGGVNESGAASSQAQPQRADESPSEVEKLKQEVSELKSKLAQAASKSTKDKPKSNRQAKLDEAKAAEAKLDEAKANLSAEIPYSIKGGPVENKKAAYIRNNRMISYKRVDEFIALIRGKLYFEDYPIIVMRAEKFRTLFPDVEIVDAHGNAIADGELDNYFVYLDGQHRGQAFIILFNLKEVSCIPGVVIKDHLEDVAKYLRAINPKGSWSNSDVASVCAMSAPADYAELMAEIKLLIVDGFNRSSASQIFCGKPITTAQFNMLVAGIAPKNKIPFNIPNGLNFIRACKAVGISSKFLAKRHFIEGYLDFKTTYGENAANAALKALPKFDEAMLKAIQSKDDFFAYLAKANS